MFKEFNVIRMVLLIVVMTAGINLCFGQMYWTRSYDSKATPVAIQTTRDGNYIIVGYDGTGWFAKINPNGDTIWTKTFGKANASAFYEIESIDGECFLLIGVSESDHINVFNGWVTKINTNGDIIWTRTYSNPHMNMNFEAIQKCTDGNFLISGIDRNNSMSLLFKITPDGDTLWTRTTSGMLFSIIVCSDDNYLVAGVNYNSVSNESETIVLKINNAGKILWARSLVNSGAIKIFPAGDGNYLLLDQINTDGRVVKITPDGDTIWTRTYSLPDSNEFFLDIISSIDGNFLIIGIGHTKSSTGTIDWLLKINPKGDTLWTRTSNIGYQDFIYTDILHAGRGKFMVLGVTSGKWTVSCIIEDQYANKDSLFTFKIPTRGLDSLNCGYQPLKIPAGMTVSAGGTVSWTPHTYSSYLENAKFVVLDDQGRKDTLSLNIFVNIQNNPSHIRGMHPVSKEKASDFFTVISQLGHGKVQFNFPASAALLSIYDMSGRLIDRINPVSSTGRQTMLWPASGTGFHSGQYIACAVAGKKTDAKVFMLGR